MAHTDPREDGDRDLLVLEPLELDRELDEVDDLEPDRDSLELEHESLERDLCRFFLVLRVLNEVRWWGPSEWCRPRLDKWCDVRLELCEGV